MLNLPLLKAYKQQIEEMSKELGIPEPADWYSTLLRLPDATSQDGRDEVSEEDLEAVLKATAEAVRNLMEFRSKEGDKLSEFFTVRVERIAELLKEVPKFENERVGKIRSKIEDALQKLPPVDLNPNRLEQEMIFYIEKLDINEEKQRLGQHLCYFTETIKAPHGQGKKLGFIAQEMGREINTLGSKSNHAEMQKIVVMMKDVLEQIKEQVLNVM